MSRNLFKSSRKGSDIASATTITIPLDGDTFEVTGTTTIAGMATNGRGADSQFKLRFQGAVQLTHGSNLALLDAADYTTVAGQEIEFRVTADNQVKQVAPVGVMSTIIGLVTALAAKAPLASPVFTGPLTLPEAAAPSTPASDKVVLYAKSDGLLYSKDDAGTETPLGGGGGGMTPCYCEIKRATNQSIPDNSATAIEFDTAVVQTDTFWVIGTPSRITIPSDGIYSVDFNIRWPSGTGRRDMYIRKNNTTNIKYLRPIPGGSIADYFDVSLTNYKFDASDYIEVYVIQTSGGSMNAEAEADTSLFVRVAKTSDV